MTDKVQKIREEVERLKEWQPIATPSLNKLLSLLDTLQEEPVSNPIDFEQELYKAFGQVKDFTLGMRIAKWFYDMGKNSQEPVSEDLEKAAYNYSVTHYPDYERRTVAINAFKAGAQWKFEHQWVSVKDRLPIEEFDDGYTFVFVNISVDEDTYRLETDYIRNGKWELHPNENITHWMPIPPIPDKED